MSTNNKVNTIESGCYCGYIWKSNEKTPIELNNEEFKESLDSSRNPFIIEGQLYDKQKGLSYSIKFVDGQYLIYKYEVKEDDKNKKEVEYVEYFANRMTHKKLCFLQYWREEVDENCNGMKVLQPKELVFIGFND